MIMMMMLTMVRIVLAQGLGLNRKRLLPRSAAFDLYSSQCTAVLANGTTIDTNCASDDGDDDDDDDDEQDSGSKIKKLSRSPLSRKSR